MIRLDVREVVGKYLSEMMNAELSQFLGRKPYERSDEETNYRNGSYGRKFTLKGIGEVSIKVPRDRNGDYETKVIPRSKQYEDEIRRDLCAVFLGGVSTRTLAVMSGHLIGRKISHTEISQETRNWLTLLKDGKPDLATEQIKYLFVDGLISTCVLETPSKRHPFWSQ